MLISPEQLQALRRYLTSQPVLKMYVFGSRARGDAKPTSDIDLLVELDYAAVPGLRFVQMQHELEELLEQQVDLVSARGLSPYLQTVIDQEKQLIYAR